MKRLIELIEDFSKRSKEDNISAYAAQAAFFLILSAFPFMILLLTLTRFLPVEQEAFIHILKNVVTEAVYQQWTELCLSHQGIP